MASIRREILIDAAPEDVWDALRDVGALHTRLVPGFVVDTRMDGDARIVTFGNGMVARELIVTIDDAERRLVWAATGGVLTHHNASAQVFAEANRTRLVWIADLKPDAAAPTIRAMIDQGASAMQRALERKAAGARP
jgi:carbon monoxide dehydrogenase subunit G